MFSSLAFYNLDYFYLQTNNEKCSNRPFGVILLKLFYRSIWYFSIYSDDRFWPEAGTNKCLSAFFG